jgi:hypothetical protein
MPISANGTGTRFYGERVDPEQEGWVTTQWVTVFYIPIVPLRSLRISFDSSAMGILYHSTNYHVLERLPLQWGQVIRVYGFLVGTLIWFGLVTLAIARYCGEPPSMIRLGIGFVVFMPMPFWVLYFIRRNQ